MDDVSFSKKANISVINRFDPQVKDIVINASQVALYMFDKTEWVKRKVEGVCFIYKRKTSPNYGVFILNRLDTNNFIEHLTSRMEIQLQEPYILFRNASKIVYGIWFYERSECIAMASVFQRIFTELKEKEKEDCVNTARDRNRIIESTDQNGHDGHSKTTNGPTDSVRQFFAKASKEATKPLPIPPGGNRGTPFQSVALIEKAHQSEQSSFSATTKPLPIPPGGNRGTPFQSVALIEKAHQSEQSSFSAPGNSAKAKQKTGLQSIVVPERTVLYPTRSDSTPNMWKESIVLPERTILCPILEPSMVRSDEYENSVQQIESNMRSMNMNTSASYEKFPQGLPVINDSTCSELPELIPPGMLLTPDLSSSYQTDPVLETGIVLKNNMLTKTQMIQAMEYLLKNDSQFIDKLYDAYLKSSRIN